MPTDRLDPSPRFLYCVSGRQRRERRGYSVALRFEINILLRRTRSKATFDRYHRHRHRQGYRRDPSCDGQVQIPTLTHRLWRMIYIEPAFRHMP